MTRCGVARLARLGQRRLRRRRQPRHSELDRRVQPGVVRRHPHSPPPQRRRPQCLVCRQYYRSATWRHGDELTFLQRKARWNGFASAPAMGIDVQI